MGYNLKIGISNGRACVNCSSSNLLLFKRPKADVSDGIQLKVTGKQHRISRNNDICITSEMALVCVVLSVLC